MVWTCQRLDDVGGDTSRPPVREGNLIAQAATFLFCSATLLEVEAVLEKPSGSMMFRSLASGQL